jgi:hypothetical protein
MPLFHKIFVRFHNKNYRPSPTKDVTQKDPPHKGTADRGVYCNYQLNQCNRVHDCQAEGRRFKPVSHGFLNLHPAHLQLQALWVPGEESRRRNPGEDSRRGSKTRKVTQMEINFLPFPTW